MIMYLYYKKMIYDIGILYILLTTILSFQYKKVSNIKESLKVCEIYSKDNYYNKFFNEIFPNYNKIEPLISDINILNPEEKVENVNIDNIEGILNYLIIKTKYKKKKDLLSQKEIVI